MPYASPALVAPQAQLSYFDTQSIALARPVTPLEAWNAAMATPLPGLAWAFWLRDAISSRFGVQRISGFSGQVVSTVTVGDRLDFFLVEGASAHQLVLTARDRHLDVMISITVTGRVLSITASVVTHNLFGRIYMLPVAPVHRWIVRALLRSIAARIS
jgi:hypothetical protein